MFFCRFARHRQRHGPNLFRSLRCWGETGAASIILFDSWERWQLGDGVPQCKCENKQRMMSVCEKRWEAAFATFWSSACLHASIYSTQFFTRRLMRHVPFYPRSRRARVFSQAKPSLRPEFSVVLPAHVEGVLILLRPVRTNTTTGQTTAASPRRGHTGTRGVDTGEKSHCVGLFSGYCQTNVNHSWLHRGRRDLEAPRFTFVWIQLALTGIGDFLTMKSPKLSIGERQRIPGIFPTVLFLKKYQ